MYICAVNCLKQQKCFCWQLSRNYKAPRCWRQNGEKKSINNNHIVSFGIWTVFIWLFSGSWLFIRKIHRVIIFHALNCLGFIQWLFYSLRKEPPNQKKKKKKKLTPKQKKRQGVKLKIIPFYIGTWWHQKIVSEEKRRNDLEKAIFRTSLVYHKKTLFWRNIPFLLWAALKRIISP